MRRLLSVIFSFVVVSVTLSAQEIHPAPHDMQIISTKTANLSKGVALTELNGSFRNSIDFLDVKGKGVKLILDYGRSVAEQAGIRPVSGAYRLEVTSKTVYITGYDRKGVIYGLQTLKQLVETAEKPFRIQECLIHDWPDNDKRGIVEAFNGYSWQQKFRLEMIDICGRLKMDKYIYAPKTDPYVAGDAWYLPYPEGKSEGIKDLMAAAGKNGMDFVWCMRPDSSFSWSESECSLLMGKFEIMYFLGVRSFGIFFDAVKDIEGYDEKKAAMLKRISDDFIAKKKDVGPLLTDLTGYFVPEDDGESLKLSVYGIGGYAWNNDAFDSLNSLEWALESSAPEIKDPYMTYALHSGVAPSAFRLPESEGLELFDIDEYTPERAESLMAEFSKIEGVRSAIRSSSYKELYRDLEPWLVEFEKLGARCRRIIECMKHCRENNVTSFWSVYADNLMSENERRLYDEYASGSVRLHPYYQSMMDALYEEFSSKSGDKVEYEHFRTDGMDTYVAPLTAEGCYLIMNNPEGHEVIIRLADGSGRYVAEFCIDTSYFEFELKENATKVEILSDIEIFDTIFVNKFE